MDWSCAADAQHTEVRDVKLKNTKCFLNLKLNDCAIDF